MNGIEGEAVRRGVHSLARVAPCGADCDGGVGVHAVSHLPAPEGFTEPLSHSLEPAAAPDEHHVVHLGGMHAPRPPQGN